MNILLKMGFELEGYDVIIMPNYKEGFKSCMTVTVDNFHRNNYPKFCKDNGLNMSHRIENLIISDKKYMDWLNKNGYL